MPFADTICTGFMMGCSNGELLAVTGDGGANLQIGLGYGGDR